MLTNKEITTRVECIIANAITKALDDPNRTYPLARSARVVARARGFSVYYWDSRKNVAGHPYKLYAFDTLILGKRTIEQNVIFDISKELNLPHKMLSQSLDCGFIGLHKENVFRYTSPQFIELSHMLYEAGNTLRYRFRDRIE